MFNKIYYYSRFVLEPMAEILIWLSRFTATVYSHNWKFFALPYFDHRFDWLLGPKNWVWAERGIFGTRIIKSGDTVLDLCCGDGAYSGLFYSRYAKHVDAIDRNQVAIDHAKKHYKTSNVSFFQRDILKQKFPQKNYDVVFFFAAIEHFTPKIGHQILRNISKSLSKSKNGILLGSTPIFLVERLGKNHPEHANEFTSVDQLRSFLKKDFKKVEMWTSRWGLDHERVDAYFWCS